MNSVDEWPDSPQGLDPGSVSFREARCTWHGTTCDEPPVKVVRTRDGARWAACERAVRTIAAERGGRPDR
ncbi:hypothetical protein ACIRQH_28150 [Streptomyces sp. NPDC102279]|uniref:hypothetical protein n=1 Tax=Streptomyces sp. NPDC102279 TaxID=3366153 RepID=UPI003827C1AF